jgi:hypothetical protein
VAGAAMMTLREQVLVAAVGIAYLACAVALAVV